MRWIGRCRSIEEQERQEPLPRDQALTFRSFMATGSPENDNISGVRVGGAGREASARRASNRGDGLV